jgi:hypothetical protein
VSYEVGKPDPKRNPTPNSDPICCITISELYLLFVTICTYNYFRTFDHTRYLMIGRESGTTHRYIISTLQLEDRFSLRCRPQILSLNCNSSRMSVIDIPTLPLCCLILSLIHNLNINGVLTFVDIDPPMQRMPRVGSSDDVSDVQSTPSKVCSAVEGAKRNGDSDPVKYF